MLAENIIKNGGATINARGEFVNLKTGYQVSKRDLGRVDVKDFTDEMAQNIIDFGLKRGEYAGFWVSDGFVYSDISRRISTKKKALQEGRALNQISILQWSTGKCIECWYTYFPR